MIRRAAPAQPVQPDEDHSQRWTAIGAGAAGLGAGLLLGSRMRRGAAAAETLAAKPAAARAAAETLAARPAAKPAARPQAAPAQRARADRLDPNVPHEREELESIRSTFRSPTDPHHQAIRDAVDNHLAGNATPEPTNANESLAQSWLARDRRAGHAEHRAWTNGKLDEGLAAARASRDADRERIRNAGSKDFAQPAAAGPAPATVGPAPAAGQRPSSDLGNRRATAVKQWLGHVERLTAEGEPHHLSPEGNDLRMYRNQLGASAGKDGGATPEQVEWAHRDRGARKAANLAKAATAHAWDEEKHPRGDHGRFTEALEGRTGFKPWDDQVKQLTRRGRVPTTRMGRDGSIWMHAGPAIRKITGPRTEPEAESAHQRPPVVLEEARRTLARMPSHYRKAGLDREKRELGPDELPIGSFTEQELRIHKPEGLSAAEHRAVVGGLTQIFHAEREGAIEAGHEPKKRGKLKGKTLIPEGTPRGLINKAYRHGAYRAMHRFGIGHYHYRMDDELKGQMQPLEHFVLYSERRVLSRMLGELKGDWQPYRKEFGMPFKDERRDVRTGEVRLRVRPLPPIIKAAACNGLMKFDTSEKRDENGRWTPEGGLDTRQKVQVGVSLGLAAGLGVMALTAPRRGRHELIRSIVRNSGTDTRGTVNLTVKHAARQWRSFGAHAADLVTKPTAVGKRPTGKELRRQFARDSFMARERFIATDRDGRVMMNVQGNESGVSPSQKQARQLSEAAAQGKLGRIMHNHPVDAVPSTADVLTTDHLEGRAPRGGPVPQSIVYGVSGLPNGKVRTRVTRHDGRAWNSFRHNLENRPELADVRAKLNEHMPYQREGLTRRVFEQAGLRDAHWADARANFGSNYRTKAVEKLAKASDGEVDHAQAIGGAVGAGLATAAASKAARAPIKRAATKIARRTAGSVRLSAQKAGLTASPEARAVTNDQARLVGHLAGSRFKRLAGASVALGAGMTGNYLGDLAARRGTNAQGKQDSYSNSGLSLAGAAAGIVLGHRASKLRLGKAADRGDQDLAQPGQMAAGAIGAAAAAEAAVHAYKKPIQRASEKIGRAARRHVETAGVSTATKGLAADVRARQAHIAGEGARHLGRAGLGALAGTAAGFAGDFVGDIAARRVQGKEGHDDEYRHTSLLGTVGNIGGMMAGHRYAGSAIWRPLRGSPIKRGLAGIAGGVAGAMAGETVGNLLDEKTSATDVVAGMNRRTVGRLGGSR